jgi:glycosyltransferase involved in cell wall biosynthesis
MTTITGGGLRPSTRAARPRHVLLVFQPVLGGVPQYVANLAEELSLRGWELSVAAPSNTPVHDRLARIAQNIVSLDTASRAAPVQDLRTCRALASLCRRTRVDVIHAHSSKAGALAAIVGRLAHVRTVYSPHAWSFQRELSAPARLACVTAERTLARRHACVIAVAEAEREAAARCRVVAPGRIALVHTGLKPAAMPSCQLARRELNIDQGAFVVGWVGRAGAQKRAEDLPVIARELRDDATLAVLGYGLPESPAGQALKQLGSVVVASGDPLSVYAACDALVVTSRWEGLPLVVLEAMRAGVPVVGYDIGGLREQVVHGLTGYVVEPGDALGLARRLRQLARNPELAQEMGQAAAQRFVARFGIERMTTAIEHIYRQILSADRLADNAGAGAPRAGSR